MILNMFPRLAMNDHPQVLVGDSIVNCHRGHRGSTSRIPHSNLNNLPFGEPNHAITGGEQC